MLPLAAVRRLTPRLASLSRVYSTHPKEVTANDPTPVAASSNVSKTNATPVASMGAQDKALVESVEEAELMRQSQAPNRKGIWSRSQKPRGQAMVGPRFEQMIMKDQVCPLE
jgi:NADH dehydrogenase (ubiquinone) Fe-S protein 6